MKDSQTCVGARARGRASDKARGALSVKFNRKHWFKQQRKLFLLLLITGVVLAAFVGLSAFLSLKYIEERQIRIDTAIAFEQFKNESTQQLETCMQQSGHLSEEKEARYQRYIQQLQEQLRSMRGCGVLSEEQSGTEKGSRGVGQLQSRTLETLRDFFGHWY